MKTSQRLQILTTEEIDAIYTRPKFNAAERIHYFLLPEKALNILKIKDVNGKSTSTKLYFILQYGYFKARHQFFNFNYHEVMNDASFVMIQYMTNDKMPTQLPTRKIQRRTKVEILQLMGYSDDVDKIDKLIDKKSSDLIRKTQNPVEIFYEVVKYLENNNTVLPSYSRLQDAIGVALKNEDYRLIKMVKRYLTKRARESLEKLLKIDGAFYHITELKFDAKHFQTNEMKTELRKLEMCKPIYDFSKRLLPKVEISRSNIEYYSNLVLHYNVTQLGKIKRELTYFYIICYVQSRCERIINNLIQSFIYHVDKFHNEAKKYAKQNLPDIKTEFEDNKKDIGKLMELYINDDIMKLGGDKIQQKAFRVMDKEQISTISKGLMKEGTSKKRLERSLIWNYHKNHYQSILLNLRPLFNVIEFESNNELKHLFKAIKFWRELLRDDKNLSKISIHRVPTNHIRPKYLIELFTESIKTASKKSAAKSVINTYQYEFYMYKLIRQNIDKSKVFINNSVDYKSFDEEVKVPPKWEKKKGVILKDLNNEVLLKPIGETLNSLEEILEPLIIRVNERIKNGENKHVNVTHHRDGTTSFTVPYQKKNPEIDNPFYDQLETKSISEFFDFAEQECSFMRKFKHIKPRGSNSEIDYLGVKAAILANATMQGTYLFSKRSNLKYKRLQTAEQNNIRLETLRDAADVIVDCMVNLPIFDIYDLSGNKHGSADGTKKKSKRRILRARHSPKYFGFDIGLVIMSMTLGHVPFSAEIIGANEHESHYIFPMLCRNNSIIDPDIISTDTAGTNNVNDFLYYLIGKIHAPCYRSLPKKAKTICGFKALSDYEGLLIKPSKSVNTKMIKKNWPKLVPVLVSLLSHETSQEKIIKKLSSHEYKSDVKDTLWELNNILKSIHMLKYIDDAQYQRDIRTSLNRGEAYHTLIDKIASVGGGEFRGMSDLEVQIWNECNRLIALIIIYYNMHLLSKLYEIALSNGDKAALDFLKHISPVASQHTTIGGLYEFTEAKAHVNVDTIVEKLSRILDKAVNTPESSKEEKEQVVEEEVT